MTGLLRGFCDDGSINEVDALVLSAAALVEIKSRPGVIEGDSHTWTWREGATVHTADNPLLLANLKARVQTLQQQLLLPRRGNRRRPARDPHLHASSGRRPTSASDHRSDAGTHRKN